MQSERAGAIPVIDLFAGPGGLGEGFSSVLALNGDPVFRIALSVEMDKAAYQTLELRAFYRAFTDVDRPAAYYEYVNLPRPKAAQRAALLSMYPGSGGGADNAQPPAWLHELSYEDRREATSRVREAVDGADAWVLVGGPPCQAYSLVGRSRRTRDATFAEDDKHTLYRHYLQIIQDLEPPIFVMENVKGMLSARLGTVNTFERVMADLEGAGPGYRLVPFVSQARGSLLPAPSDFIVRAEEHGVPQARHRVIVLGLRRDACSAAAEIEPSAARVPVEAVLHDLPRLRSRLSGRNGSVSDSETAWLDVLGHAASQLRALQPEVGAVALEAVRRAREGVSEPNQSHRAVRLTADLLTWYRRDARILRPLNHEPRSHKPSDIVRYMFCASFARVHGRSPKLSDFPAELLPEHGNVHDGKFDDRFRVQLGGAPSTTVTSHMSKDGHYYIHYDPSQCRSLSVREAARLQTFPDDYYFEGNRTQQYHQVGNAVPPFLARQLAKVVAAHLGKDCEN